MALLKAYDPNGNKVLIDDVNQQMAEAEGFKIVGPHNEQSQQDSLLKNALMQSGRINPQEQQMAQQQQPGMLANVEQAILNNPVGKFAVGAGDAIKNQLAGVANLIPGVNIPHSQNGEGLFYSLGNVGGNLAGFLGGGGALNLARQGAESLPLIGQAAKALGGEGISGIARRALGIGAYGATETPEDRGMGALKSGAISTALDLGTGIAGKVARGIRPQKLADEIMKEISGGGRTLEQNAQALSKNVERGYTQSAKEPSQLYNKLTAEVPKDNYIFSKTSRDQEKALESLERSYAKMGETVPETVLKKFGIDRPQEGLYTSLDKEIFRKYGPDLKEFHYKLLENPNYENAHMLSKQLGDEIRMFKGPLNQADRNTLQEYEKAKNTLDKNIVDFLEKQNPQWAQDFQKANYLWATNVRPYKSNPTLYKMARGEKENPGNIATIFKNPEEDIRKVIGDLGEEGKNQILYSQLGKLSRKELPEHLINGAQSIKNQGLESYISPKIQDKLDKLSSRVTFRNIAQRAGGALAGGLLGAKTMGPAAGMLGMAGAAAATPYLSAKVSPVIEALSKISPSSEILKQALLANLIGEPTKKKIMRMQLANEPGQPMYTQYER